MSRTVFRALLVLFSFMMLFIPGLGLLDLPSIFPGLGLANQAPFDVAHGIVTVLLITPALLAQLLSPQSKIAAIQQLAAIAVALAVTGLAGLDARDGARVTSLPSGSLT
ncbi:MAG TPA: hypothetical protein VIN56_11970 [Candidatus Dormibacteraeota bacterium]|jgi:hypothetical protein